jgi:hypothetical protein
MKRLIYRCHAFNCYSLAVSLGFPFIDSSNGRASGETWMGRFTSDSARLQPGIWVGVQGLTKFIVEIEEGAVTRPLLGVEPQEDVA